jgi:hypothetical protein
MKLCECGCGVPTHLVTQTNRGLGVAKGEPRRFLPGHQARVSREPIEMKYRVDEATGCWEWLRAKVRGYGVVNDPRTGHNAPAHRYLYELHREPIPTGLVIDHLCRNPGCVNPWHLEPVTDGENVLRGVGPSATNARKTYCKHGHEFTPENTKVSSDGKRSCIACRRALRKTEEARAKRREYRHRPENKAKQNAYERRVYWERKVSRA